MVTPLAVASTVTGPSSRPPPSPDSGSGCPAFQSIDVVAPPTTTGVMVAPPTPRSDVVTVNGVGKVGMAVLSRWAAVSAPLTATDPGGGAGAEGGIVLGDAPPSTPPLSSRVWVALSHAL